MERHYYVAIIKLPIVVFSDDSPIESVSQNLACTTGREQECAKIAVKGYSHFAASTAAGIWVGNAGAGLAIAACSIVLGAATAGTGVIVCGIAGAAIDGAAGSTLDGMGSDYLTTLVVGE